MECWRMHRYFFLVLTQFTHMLVVIHWNTHMLWVVSSKVCSQMEWKSLREWTLRNALSDIYWSSTFEMKTTSSCVVVRNAWILKNRIWFSFLFFSDFQFYYFDFEIRLSLPAAVYRWYNFHDFLWLAIIDFNIDKQEAFLKLQNSPKKMFRI